MFVVERNKTLLNFDRSNELELIVERFVMGETAGGRIMDSLVQGR